MKRFAFLLFAFLTSCSGAAVEPEIDFATTTFPVAPATSIPAPSTSTVTASTETPAITRAASMTTVGDAPTTTAARPDSGPVAVGPRDDWYVVWVTARHPDGFADSLRAVAGVEIVSEVWVGNAEVTGTTDATGRAVDETTVGFVLPIELHAIDPVAHASFVPPEVAATLAVLEPDEVLLGETSARFRRLDAGATVTLSTGIVLTVAGVVPDRWVGYAEMVTTSTDPPSLGADRPRYAVVKFTGSKSELSAAITRLTDRAVRVWAEHEVDVFRHADAVRPQIEIKRRFGEFSYRARTGGRIEIDPDWVDANIVTIELPLIGAVRCHRDFADLLKMVMEQIAASAHPEVVNPSSDLGCFSQRFIAGRRDLSRHAWGIAADINWGNALDATRSPVAPELLAATTEHGITSGHDWINPDPGHFEWIGLGP